MRTMIPLEYPIERYEYAAPRPYAHWTSYPTYSYEQFARANGAAHRRKAKRNVRAENLAAELERRPRARANPLSPSPFIGTAKPYLMPDNAGPYLPDMYPFGSGGRPATYAASNPSAVLTEKKLDPEHGSWPVHDQKHAILALIYMLRGFGSRKDYPTYIFRLADIWSVRDPNNAPIWERYGQWYKRIEGIAKRPMPDLEELRQEKRPGKYRDLSRR